MRKKKLTSSRPLPLCAYGMKERLENIIMNEEEKSEEIKAISENVKNNTKMIYSIIDALR